MSLDNRWTPHKKNGSFSNRRQGKDRSKKNLVEILQNDMFEFSLSSF